jgi:deoxyribonuclease-4
MRLGFHILIGGGLHNTIQGALERRCQTLQVFASAPVQWKTRRLDPEEDARFVEDLRRFDLYPLFVHAPYLLNLASPDPALVAKSIKRLVFDLRVAHEWQAEGVILHLGSGGADTHIADAMRRVAAGLRSVLRETEGPTRLILENSAGQGNIVGDTPEELARVIELAGRERLGLCLDTAHAFAAGYALHTREGLDSLLGELDQRVGLDLLRVVHANDSWSALGSNHDRHAHIGRGKIGPAGWRIIMAHEKLRHLPFIMETPKEPATAVQDDLRNLRALRRYIPREFRPPLPRPRQRL